MLEERRDLDIQKLRQETEAHHRAVEDAVPLMHEGLDKVQYLRCLQQMYGIVAAWEERAIEAAPEWMQPTVIARQRKQLLESDLAWFGITELDDRRPKLPEINSLPRLLGAMYVMEGSTLGGQLIARHVENSLQLTASQGDAFFRGYADRTGSMWKDFCAILTRQVPDDQTDTVIEAAKAMFEAYGAWMRENSALDGC